MICSQNPTSTVRWNWGGSSERDLGRISRPEACQRRTAKHLHGEVLRQPIESTLMGSMAVRPTLPLAPDSSQVTGFRMCRSAAR